MSLPKPKAATGPLPGDDDYGVVPKATGTVQTAGPAVPKATQPTGMGTAVAGLSADGTWTPQSESVGDRVATLTSQDSQLMQQARGMGMKQAASRGLLNSTMAARAGESAAISAATPIASQEAAQIADKNNALVAGKQQRDLAAQQAEAERARSLELQTLSGKQASELATQNAATEKELTKIKTDADWKTAQLAADTNLKTAATTAAAQMVAGYNDTFSAIMQNTKLKADARSNYLTSLQNSTKAGFNLINQTTGANLQWGTPQTAPLPPGPTTTGLGGMIDYARSQP